MRWSKSLLRCRFWHKFYIQIWILKQLLHSDINYGENITLIVILKQNLVMLKYICSFCSWKPRIKCYISADSSSECHGNLWSLFFFKCMQSLLLNISQIYTKLFPLEIMDMSEFPLYRPSLHHATRLLYILI